MASQVNKFLDIEAEASNDNNNELGSEGDDGMLNILKCAYANKFALEFIFDDDENATDNSNNGTYQWADLEDWQDDDNGPQFLENLVNSIREWYRGPPTEKHGTSDEWIGHLPTEEDLLW